MRPHRTERRDVDPRAVSIFAASLVAFLVTALLVLGLTFGAPSLEKQVEGGASPPQTRLEDDPRADRAAFDAEKSAELNALGWIDRSAGIARVPIADAMRLLAQKGIPDWGQNGPIAAASDCALLRRNVPRAPQAADCGDGGGAVSGGHP